MSRSELIAICLKGLAAWLALSGLGWYFSEALGQCLLPGFSYIVSQFYPELSPLLTLVPENHDFNIHLSALVLRPLHLGEQQWLSPGLELTAGTHLMHTLVPMVIELSILLVWPVNGWRGRISLLALGFVTSLLVLGMTAPFVLLGNLEIYLQELAGQANVQRPESWLLTWMIFCEMGGRWVIPIVAALLCVQLEQSLCRGVLKPRLGHSL